jgi:hypothetical protein
MKMTIIYTLYIYIYSVYIGCVYIYICIYKETVVGALRLFQYFQLPDKNSLNISRYVYNFLQYFKIVMYKVVQICPGLIVCKQVTVCPGHI